MDGCMSDSIIVFFDKKKLPKASLPPQYKGFNVALYDVRYVLNTSNVFLGLVKKENVDLEEKQKSETYKHFVHTVELCKEMLA
jgi:hypothetical protein